ncbi:hypothetical protein OS493_024505 [Desmophyllum pertusum]|uniref:Uncharacterized protein n=1 Tax=Desmophyllum pertusum TaxID=174260 RepID=A0A9W9YBZ6_9CNID|nr:hypothetical protein OS493_024505 [Desmophyllum pertusum]
MKDQSGRTALHVSAVNMSNIKHPNSSIQARGALFHLNCLKCMIRRLLTLLDASVLTKREVMEVMKSAENSNGDSVLHMLARDSAHGFALLKRVKDRLFGINGTLNFNNRENKTVLAVAWETDAQATMQMFSVFYPPRCRPESSTRRRKVEETDGEASTDVVDVDMVEPQTSHSSNLEERPDLGTGNLFALFTIPLIVDEDDLPYVSQSAPLFSEEC